MFSKEMLISFLLSLPAILISLTVHEYCHGYAAYRMGDNTAKAFGRLSLNPLKHIDPIGFLCLLIARFGWAKPVPINPRNFRNYKKGMFWVSVAGPLSNLCLAFGGVILYAVMARYLARFLTPDFLYLLVMFFQIFITMNLSLFVFNLIPIPPLDGSKMFGLLLPRKVSLWLLNNERYIQIVLWILLLTGRLSPLISTCTYGIMNGMFWIISWIPFL